MLIKSGIYYLSHTIEQSMHGAHNLARDQGHQAPHRKTKGQKRSRSSSAVGGRGILFFRKVQKFVAHQELSSPLRGAVYPVVQ